MGWDEIRRNVAQGLSWVKARENSIQAVGTTLEQSILEAVVELDSSQTDVISTLGEGNLLEYRDDGALRPGQLQRLEQMKEYFFGDADTEGLLDAMRESEDPNYLENPEQ